MVVVGVGMGVGVSVGVDVMVRMTFLASGDDPSRGRVTATWWFDGVEDVGLGHAVADGNVGRLHVLICGPGLAGHGVQGVCAGRLLGGLPKVALAQGGHAAAGAA